ncbi:efflux transporter, outer membrane factor (OMF) lipoprotein, NodT family [Nonlabens sp. Hel1_33_55]|uniref:efflux transporter outer membrane subunit n=1 Tax=Nonlabens sp. Hel1_33_55 TaxID=1336802 RepID=UPI000875F0F0|nr:efflux transporter outer membrane subunit [Nonlabens sp. Hel1_33_55]SCY19887.1 efflux transporter, outer membrane factor (OMF) lipoprotein, NodT family [Nonlabens sp. Hel1_33_55]
MNKSIVFKYLILASIPFVLISCFSAKEYVRPEEEVITADYYRTDQLPADSLSLATVSYKELFTDPQLQGYIEEGLKNNNDIRIAIQQILISEALLKQGKARYLPSIDATAQYSRSELSENSQFGGQFSTLNQYQLSGGLSWEADIWGKIRSNKRAAEATYLQSVAAHKAVKSTLVANIASIYYQLLSLDEQVRITDETVTTRSRALETTEALKEAGIVTAVGVKQTEAQLYTAQAILIDLNNQRRLLENSLSVLLGNNAQAISRGSLDNQEITSDLKTGVPSQLLANRPDVISAEYSLINAFELTNVARSRFYPSLTVTANGGLQSLDFDKLFSTSSLFATLVGGLTQPIFNQREIRTQYEVAQAQQEQSKLDFKQALLVAGREVSDALFNYEASTDRKDVKQKEFEAYALATQYSEELLDNGLVNYIEVLRARENQLNSSLDVISARNNQLQSIVDLYQALGGGWQ